MCLNSEIDTICKAGAPQQGTMLKQFQQKVLDKAKAMTVDARKKLRAEIDAIVKRLSSDFEAISSMLRNLKVRIKKLDLAPV